VTEERRSHEKNIPLMPTFTYKPIVHRGEKRILIYFTYNAKTVAELRQKTNAKWSKTHAAWHIADTAEHRIKCKLPQESEEIISSKKTIVPVILHTKKIESIAVKKPSEKPTKPQPTLLLKPIKNKNKEDRIALYIPGNKIIFDIIKRLAAVKWSENLQCWHIPCTEADYQAACNVLHQHVIINTKPLAAYLQKRQTANAVQQTAGHKKAASLEQVINISQHNMLLLQRMVEQLQLKAYSPSTLRTYKNEVGIFLQTIKNKKADTLTTEDVRRYIHHCINKLQLSENTMHSRLNALKFLYEQVLGHEKFFVEIPRPKKHLQLPKVLGEEELRRLFNAPTNLKHKAILFVAYSAGLRVSEVINLRLQDIDRERRQLFIYCSKGKKDRYVMLSPMVLDVLEQYYKMSEVKPKNYLFEGYEKGQPYTIRSAQKIFTEAKVKAGIIKSVTFHSLRHSFATHLLEKGTDVIFIKDLLGHFDIRTTERYLHVKRDVLISIASPVDSLYKKK
jgi:integrase/recombinase XerD